MPATADQLRSIGPRFAAGIFSTSFGFQGLFLKNATFHKDLQAQLRDEVVAALSLSIGDRDIAFWKRQSQGDWSHGALQTYFSDLARFDKSQAIDVHTPGQLRLVPQPAVVAAATGALNGRGATRAWSCSFFPWRSMSIPLARSITFRASRRSARSPTSDSRLVSSAWRPSATSMAGIRSLFWNGLTM